MAIFEQNVDVSNLIKLTNGGIQVASFVEIRDMLIKQMQRIYGNDIDVSSVTADGQWLNSIALILNNMCQVIRHSYDMLDPSTATGAYLDILCSYNNIARIGLSSSKAQLLVKNISGSPQGTDTTPITAIQFIDRAGNYWTWRNPGVTKDGRVLGTSVNKNYKWATGEVKLLTDVECDTLGRISAGGTGIPIDSLVDSNDSSITGWDAVTLENNGFINQTVQYGIWQVYQEKDAESGTNEESDEALRSRRILSMGNQAVSVLSGLEGALLNISGINDAWIYDNKESQTKEMDDGTQVPQHSTYVCLRYTENATIDDSLIGMLIYNKMTPGIPTIGPAANFIKTIFASEPSDWSTIYSQYVIKHTSAAVDTSSTNFTTNTYCYQDGDDYRILLEKPSDWGTNTTDYYEIWFNSGSGLFSNATSTFDTDAEYYKRNSITGELMNFKVNKTSSLIYNIYWKKCLPYTFTEYLTGNNNKDAKNESHNNKFWIKINIKLSMSTFDFATGVSDGTLHRPTTDVELSITNKLINYLTGIRLGEDLSGMSLCSTAQKGDILKNGFATFFVTDSVIAEDTDNNGLVNLKNTYINVTSKNFYFSTKYSANDVYTDGMIFIGLDNVIS